MQHGAGVSRGTVPTAAAFGNTAICKDHPPLKWFEDSKLSGFDVVVTILLQACKVCHIGDAHSQSSTADVGFPEERFMNPRPFKDQSLPKHDLHLTIKVGVSY